MADFGEQGLSGPEALEIVARTSLAWTQLRDMGLERSWQSGFGWFMARNLMIYGVVALGLVYVLGLPQAVLDGGLAGAAIYYLIVMALSPLRTRSHKRRRAGILQAYGTDLSSYLDTLER
jgi:Flp pilus assembly protein TadB